MQFVHEISGIQSLSTKLVEIITVCRQNWWNFQWRVLCCICIALVYHFNGDFDYCVFWNEMELQNFTIQWIFFIKAKVFFMAPLHNKVLTISDFERGHFSTTVLLNWQLSKAFQMVNYRNFIMQRGLKKHFYFY